MSLNSRLGNGLSWVDNTDCCQWEGVECNTTTGRVAQIKLHSYIGPWHLNYSDFLIFKDLKILDLSSAQISNCTRVGQG
ncbi:LRR amino-terminal domain protein [Trifolium medium]|uniref:LRR amino-terminal domain protein n=1 Tax=Trifolium medium TaxID=97028 RepID=A0A392MWA1_9FABA|nr:LRR amino-terminal domain protein [Trifolium medium]